MTACTLGVALAMAAGGVTFPDLRHPALNKVTLERAPTRGVVRLIADGRPQVTLVIAPEAPEARNAADDLAEGFRLVTGAPAPIVPAGKPVDGTRILLGAAGEAAGIPAGDLPADGFRIATLTNGVAIVGRGNGVGYGVCDFQERVLGIRWYYPGPDGTVARPLRTLSLPACAYSDYPRQGRRFMWPPQAKGIVPDDACRPFGPLLDHPVFLSMVRHLRAGYAGPAVGCHTFPNFAAYAKEYPACFELSANGARASGDAAMPCYGNPETLRLHVQALERFYAAADTTPWLLPPERKVVYGAPLQDTVSFSPLDAPLACQCDCCAALRDPGGGRWGEYSRVAATFAAGLAREIETRWPGRILTYLPYQNYTEPPTGVTFPGNVHVQVCLMNGVGMAKEPAIAAQYARWISGWHRITGHPVQLWEYICFPDEHSLPILCLHTARTFRQAHAAASIGSFLNGAYAGPQDLPGGTWACGHPMIYGLFRLLWNPDYDVDAMLDDYVRSMYGPAAKPMGALLRLLQDRWEQTRWSRVPTDTYHADLDLIHAETAPPAVAARLAQLLAKARRRAGASGVYRWRVEFFGRAVDVFLKESEVYHGAAKPPLPSLRVARADAAPACDGTLDEPCWRTAETQPLRRAFVSWRADPEQPTTIRGMWCEAGVAFALDAQEPCMDTLRLVHDTRHENLAMEDGGEVFLDVQGRGTNSYQLIANAKAAWWDMVRRRNAAGAMENWRCALPGVEVGAARGAAGWTIEVFIPFAALDLDRRPQAGDTWKANFIRNRRAAGDYALQRWSTRYRPANADPDAMGTLRFTGQ